jgi:hypothetical protein
MDPQRTPLLVVLLLHDAATGKGRIENTVPSGTPIGYVAWHIPLLHHRLLCHCLSMAASSIFHVVIFSSQENKTDGQRQQIYITENITMLDILHQLGILNINIFEAVIYLIFTF